MSSTEIVKKKPGRKKKVIEEVPSAAAAVDTDVATTSNHLTDKFENDPADSAAAAADIVAEDTTTPSSSRKRKNSSEKSAVTLSEQELKKPRKYTKRSNSNKNILSDDSYITTPAQTQPNQHQGDTSTKKLRFKLLHDGAYVPKKATPGSAGYDLYLPKNKGEIDPFEPGKVTIHNHQQISVNLGVSVEIPEGYCGVIESRSSLAKGYGITAFHGIIDRDYRGPLIILLSMNQNNEKLNQSHTFYAEDRVAQLVLYKIGEFDAEVVNELSETARGQGGFGSTGV